MAVGVQLSWSQWYSGWASEIRITSWKRWFIPVYPIVHRVSTILLVVQDLATIHSRRRDVDFLWVPPHHLYQTYLHQTYLYHPISNLPLLTSVNPISIKLASIKLTSIKFTFIKMISIRLTSVKVFSGKLLSKNSSLSNSPLSNRSLPKFGSILPL